MKEKQNTDVFDCATNDCAYNCDGACRIGPVENCPPHTRKRLAWMACVWFTLLSMCAGCTARALQLEKSAPLATTYIPTTAPTVDPVATPAPTPEPVTDEMLATGRFDGYFDGTVFLGDSLTVSLYNYCLKQRQENERFLGDAQFLAAVGMSVRMASYDSRNLLQYEERAVGTTEGLLKMNAKRVFVMLGVNDFAGKYPEATLQYFEAMIDAIQQKCKGTEIVVQGVLPVSEEFCRQRHVSVEDWNGFNLLLEQLCVDKGVRYFSFAKQMMDENGYLSADLTSDGMCHINTEGTAIWVKSLRRFAAEQHAQSDVYSGEKQL